MRKILRGCMHLLISILLINLLGWRFLLDTNPTKCLIVVSAMPSMNHSDQTDLPVVSMRGGGSYSSRNGGVNGGGTRDEMRREGRCIPNICGNEAACKPHKDNTYSCVCPHDNSAPTDELRCPNRNTGIYFIYLFLSSFEMYYFTKYQLILKIFLPSLKSCINIWIIRCS